MDKLQQVIDAVKQASKIMVGDRFQVFEKDGSANLVTSNDLAVQEFLYKKLHEIMPLSGFIGEEEDVNDIKEDNIWIVDPIDGTANYTRGLNLSVISVALMHKGELELGVVYNPFNDDLYYAQKGKGAFNNNQPIHVSKRSFKEGFLCTALSLYKKEYAEDCLNVIKDAYQECNDIRRFGTCALELCYLASGKCDLYFEIRIFPWDYAAGEIILEEAGGILTGRSGKKLTRLEPTPLIGANSAENHKKLLEICEKNLHRENYL